MITNLPSHNDFEKVAKECFLQAIESFFTIYNNYREYDDENIYEEVPLNIMWEHNLPITRTAIILLHQGIETYMKGVIVKSSPYLLLEQKRSDWPTLPNSHHKSYDSLFTIAGENLLHTFCAVCDDINIDQKTIDFIESIRKKRNFAIHGSGSYINSVEEIILDILKAYTLFFGKASWFVDLKEARQKNPLFGYYDWEFESIQSYKYLDFIELTIGIKKLKSFLNFDMTGRRYFCPTCLFEMTRNNEYMKSKWAFLMPNDTFSSTVYCINCNHDNEVERIDCNICDCKGNAIDMDGICLSCGEQQI